MHCIAAGTVCDCAYATEELCIAIDRCNRPGTIEQQDLEFLSSEREI